ncbi:MAG TPA: LysM peptidoglycan-binding domain-containing protein [Steroidobacteraceae bacterium]|nr:LysM peptidoglycan-binding domain-containing protein [Steroidobacteraceae bacterium]
MNTSRSFLTRFACVPLLATALLAGCATTDSTYSSLPPAPEHPADRPALDRNTVTIPGPGLAHTVPHLPPDQYEDILDRIRDGYALPDVQHFAVDREVELYRSRPDFLDRTFKRGSRYLHYIVTEIEKRGMPLELALLPVVESAFNPVAYSRSRASGLWQFIPSSGKHYGLEQDWWIDERRDVIEATQAALSYLQYLNTYFGGDWFLAIAAYNGGEGTVRSAVRRNQERGLSTDFWSLELRSETRDYVPKLLAISRIVRDPGAYGLTFAAIPNKPYFDVVDPGRQVHLGDAADLAGITRDDMFALNPGYNRMTTPPKGPHRLLLPIPNAEQFRQAMLDQATLEAEGKVLVAAVEPPPEVRHRVRRGDTLSAIAREYGVPIETLRAANDLKGAVIHPGQSLLVPQPAAGASATLAMLAAPREDIAAQLPERQRPSKQASSSKPRVHVVKSGDTLWGVARRYGVTVPTLASANGLSNQAGLVPGARLEIPGAGGSRAAASGDGAMTTYKVRRGDTLSEIADRFNVTVREIMTWNRLRQSSSLRTGQRLVLYVDSSRSGG